MSGGFNVTGSKFSPEKRFDCITVELKLKRWYFSMLLQQDKVGNTLYIDPYPMVLATKV
ncbi:MAG: hypothetical protein CM15mV26_0740 [uncultured marine virus]|nr:MAG: hypothetical protein CM15mV26_0740 [uncultured marine virus]